jgi:ABC-2 type transport system ATP-binding protein
MTIAIEIDNLTKDYETGFWRKRKMRALDGLSLTVDSGQIFGFLGANGAGKTTTLKLLMGLIYPTAGTARILNRDIGDVAMHARIGYLPENPYFYDYLTAREFLNYCGELFGLDRVTRERRTEELLTRVNLETKGWDRHLRKFSKGMLQRVGLAQAVLNDPDVLFLDEPMSGLDPLGRRDVRALILDLRKRGCTIFFSSHILSDAEALCDRVAVLARGRLVAQGRVADLVEFEIKGWELIVGDLDGAVLARLGTQATKVAEIAGGRYALELPGGAAPDRMLAELTAAGGKLVSLNPIRETLEDFFVKQVGAATVDRLPSTVNR